MEDVIRRRLFSPYYFHAPQIRIHIVLSCKLSAISDDFICLVPKVKRRGRYKMTPPHSLIPTMARQQLMDDSKPHQQGSTEAQHRRYPYAHTSILGPTYYRLFRSPTPAVMLGALAFPLVFPKQLAPVKMC